MVTTLCWFGSAWTTDQIDVAAALADPNLHPGKPIVDGVNRATNGVVQVFGSVGGNVLHGVDAVAHATRVDRAIGAITAILGDGGFHGLVTESIPNLAKNSVNVADFEMGLGRSLEDLVARVDAQQAWQHAQGLSVASALAALSARFVETAASIQELYHTLKSHQHPVNQRFQAAAAASNPVDTLFPGYDGVLNSQRLADMEEDATAEVLLMWERGRYYFHNRLVSGVETSHGTNMLRSVRDSAVIHGVDSIVPNVPKSVKELKEDLSLFVKVVNAYREKFGVQVTHNIAPMKEIIRRGASEPEYANRQLAAPSSAAKRTVRGMYNAVGRGVSFLRSLPDKARRTMTGTP